MKESFDKARAITNWKWRLVIFGFLLYTVLVFTPLATTFATNQECAYKDVKILSNLCDGLALGVLFVTWMVGFAGMWAAWDNSSAGGHSQSRDGEFDGGDIDL